MSISASPPATTPIPVQVSEHEFTALLFPHLSMPKRGPQCTLGSHGVFTLLLWGLSPGMQRKGLPSPIDAHGQGALHAPDVYRALAPWAQDGSLWQALVARVRHLAAETQLDLSVLHGDGTHTVATTGAMGSGTRGTNTSKGRKSSRSRTTMATSSRPSPWRPSPRPPRSGPRRA